MYSRYYMLKLTCQQLELFCSVQISSIWIEVNWHLCQFHVYLLKAGFAVSCRRKLRYMNMLETGWPFLWMQHPLQTWTRLWQRYETTMRLWLPRIIKTRRSGTKARCIQQTTKMNWWRKRKTFVVIRRFLNMYMVFYRFLL